jgi:CheY-like chemotaxis protein
MSVPPKAEIIVAEDSPTQAAQIRILLEQAGFATRLAQNGREAVELVRQALPDLVLTDLQMPKMNGLEVVETLRLEFPKLPVVLTTALGSETIAAQALHKGAASYVPKKVLETELIPTLERILAVIAVDREGTRLDQFIEARETHYLLENDLSLIAALIARFQDEMQQFGVCDEAGAMQVATALDEALTNAMIHGNLEISSGLRAIDNGEPYVNAIKERQVAAPYRDRHVSVSAKISRREVEYSIRDEGPGFDVSSVPDPSDECNLENICGRGIFLINAFMDDVRYNEKGNEITMIKRT